MHANRCANLHQRRGSFLSLSSLPQAAARSQSPLGTLLNYSLLFVGSPVKSEDSLGFLKKRDVTRVMDMAAAQLPNGKVWGKWNAFKESTRMSVTCPTG